AAAAADLAMAIAQSSDLTRDSIGRIPIVVIPMHDEFTAGLLAGEVALCPDGHFAIETKVANAFALRHAIHHRLRAVVNHQQLEVWIVLPQKATDRLRHKRAAVVSGHDASDQRSIG